MFETRSWWAKGERVVWRIGDAAATGTVLVPRGDYSWVVVDGGDGRGTLVANDDLRKLPADRDPAAQELASSRTDLGV